MVGNNGIGKTNLLDAVYYLCLTKSYLFADDKQNINYQSEFFRLQGTIEREGAIHKVVCKYAGGRKKEFLVDDSAYSKLSEHIGKFPCVMICPLDSEIVTGSSEERRKVIDSTLSQTDSDYLNNLVLYNKILAQRNAALKQFAESQKNDFALLEIYNKSLVETGNLIHQKRIAAFAEIESYFNAVYSKIANDNDQLSLNFKSQLNGNNFKELLEKNLQKDLVLERTEIGIHKDDIEFYLNKFPIKRFGSQGQQKSVMIAFKLAMFLFMKDKKGFAPILIIDDVFDKLDKVRCENLMHFLNSDATEQVLLSHTKDQDFEGFSFVDILKLNAF
jgi:DNA replication and repair protein RecF